MMSGIQLTHRTVLLTRAVIFGTLLGMAGCHSLNSPSPAGQAASRSHTTTDHDTFKPPQAEQWTLPNGIEVIFLPDHELPLVSASLYLRGGSLWEPDSQNGLVTAMGELMRQGGAGEFSADALDKELEKLAAGIGTSFGEEYGTLSLECLSSDVDRVFSIFSDILLRPRFEESRVSLWKGRMIEGIRRRRDDADTVASIAFTELLYAGSTYGTIITEADIGKINRRGLIQQYERFVRPNGAIFAITGDLTREQVNRLAEQYFGEWQPSGDPLPPPPAVPPDPAPGIYFIQLPFEQSAILMGQLGVERLSPDSIDIEAFNHIFGSGGFGSRLMERIRTELGLVYGVYGAIMPAVVRGKNIIGLQTKAQTTGEAIVEAMKVLQSLQTAPVPAAELQETQDTISNSFVFRLDSSSELVRRYALLKLLNYPSDYDLTYLPRLRAVDTEGVLQVARSRWDLGKFVIVVVGNETAYNSLEKLSADRPPFLQNMKLYRVNFSQHLELPAREVGQTVNK